ncbi:MAG: DinB family protein, partial [Chitinophagales bacterium]
EIVNHMIRWRETVLERIQGTDIPSPGDNYFSFIRDRSEGEWLKTLKRFQETQALWLDAIIKMKRKDFNTQHKFSSYSNYECVHGILQHDAYHLGQIRLLKKMIQLR